MADRIALSLLIRGDIDPSLTRSAGRTREALAGLTDGIRKLRDADKKTRALGKLQADLEPIRQRLKASSQETVKLARALRTVEQPSKAMRDAFAKASRETEKLKRQFREKAEAISLLRRELRGAGVDTNRLVAEQGRLDRALGQQRAAQERLSSARAARQRNRDEIKSLYAQGVEVAALGYALARTLRPAIEFEAAMADVAKVVEFESTAAMQGFGEQLKDLSRQIPLTAVELAQIAAAGGRLGLSAAQLPDFVQVVARMATAFDLLPEEAGNAIAKLSNIFDIPISDIERLGDAVNQLANNTAAREADIVNVLTRIGGTAQQFDLTAQQAAALADAFLALGRPPQVAATAINALLNRLQAAEAQSQTFQDGLASLGTSSEQLAAQIKANPQRALLDFLGTLRNLDKQARAVVLTNLFGQEYADDISILVGGLDQYQKALGLVADETSYAGGVAAEFGKRMETTEARVQTLQNRLSEIANNFGTALLPAIEGVSVAVGALATGVAEIEKAAPGLIAAIGGTVGVLLAARAASVALALSWRLLKAPGLAVVELLAGLGAKGVIARTALGGVGETAAGTTGLVGRLSGAVGGLSGALSKLGLVLRGGGVITAIAAIVYGVKSLADAMRDAADASRTARENQEAYVRGLRTTLEINQTYADLQVKTAEQLAKLSDDELRQYDKRLTEAEQYWRARSLLESEFTGEVDRQTAERRRIVLQGLRDLTKTLGARENLYKGHADRVAEARQAETAAIRAEFEKQDKIYDAEKSKLAEIQRAREQFKESVKDALPAAQAPGEDLIANTVLAPISELRRGQAAIGEGDFKSAEQSAQKVVAQLKALGEAGKISKGFLKTLLGQASELGDAAFNGLEEQQQAAVDAAKQKLQDLLNDLDLLKKIEIGFDTDSAFQSVEALRAKFQEYLQNNPIVVPVQAGGADPKLPDAPGFASGGSVSGPGTGTSDSILSWLSNGEFVLKAAAVRRYGLGFLHRLNNMQLPAFASGGLVTPSVPSLSAESGGAASGAPLYITLNGQQYQATVSGSDAPSFRKALMREKMKRGGQL